MLQKLIQFVQMLWDRGEEVKRLSTKVDELEDENDRMRRAMEFLVARDEARSQEIQHIREVLGKDMENLELRLKLKMLEESRQLPPKESEK